MPQREINTGRIGALPMKKLRIKDWHKFQHFKDRRPPWIKLYRDLLDDPDWHDLEADVAKVLIMLWLIASEDETQSGLLPSEKRIAFRLRMTEQKINSYISKLSHFVIHDDITMISDRYHDDTPETETDREETDKEKNTKKENLENFSKFWDSYPRKRRGNKQKALQAWNNALERASAEDIIGGLMVYARSEEVAKGFAKGSQAWLNDDRWTWYPSEEVDKLPEKPITADDLGLEGEGLAEIFDLLRRQHGDAIFRSWFSSIRVKSRKSATLILTVPTNFIREWINSHYHGDLQAAINNIWPMVIDTSVEVIHVG